MPTLQASSCRIALKHQLSSLEQKLVACKERVAAQHVAIEQAQHAYKVQRRGVQAALARARAGDGIGLLPTLAVAADAPEPAEALAVE